MVLLVFLAKVVFISLSGVVAPGPVTAVTLEMGTRNRHAGALVAIGHGIVEFPLIIVITLGMGTVFQITAVNIAIGLAGGAFLWLMAIGMLQALTNTDQQQQAAPAMKGPLTAGIILSGGNPYFLFWWATIGIKLATDARAFGIWAFAVFAVLHWTCDLVWLWFLSWAGYRGSTLLGPKFQKIVMLICGLALLLFGLMFIIDASVKVAAL